MNMDLNEHRVKKERGKTPSEVLQNHLKRDDIENIIVIVENKDGIQEHEISAESDNDALLMLVKALSHRSKLPRWSI